MSYKKLSQEFTPKELADARKKSLEKMTEEERLTGNLMGLKFRMED